MGIYFSYPYLRTLFFSGGQPSDCGNRPDIVFLDIQIPGINGFEMLELLDHTPVKAGQISGLEQYEKESYIAILKNGAKLKVSKSGYKRLKDVLKL